MAPPPEDDEITTDSGTILTKSILTPDGACAKHPNIRLRGYDQQTGQPYQMDSCPECDNLFLQNKQNLQTRKEELDRQLQLLDDKEEASRSSRPTLDEEQRAGSVTGPTGGGPPPAAA